ncbi:antibiotic biosynthesis monooxygenase family protein [Streptacidiphilus pinicola]|uniref:antibiotic biosynthesis monooxygenase family protein n=1 Tax=Streptacidiphilus pinicola TaxID=2219663 RepID=UPI0024373A96|nr:antibiotic biosynthesis monooxygenase [Streptacidiphilus pinicola]
MADVAAGHRGRQVVAPGHRPERQQAVIDVIRTAGDPGAVPGLRRVHLLRGLDGTQVVNQMLWESREAFEQARAHLPVIERIRAEVERLVEKAVTEVYEVVPVS